MSSDRCSHALEKFDYRGYNDSGKKIAKEAKKFEKFAAMANNEIIDEEKKICLKVKRFLDEYDCNLLFDMMVLKRVFLSYENLLIIMKTY